MKKIFSIIKIIMFSIIIYLFYKNIIITFCEAELITRDFSSYEKDFRKIVLNELKIFLKLGSSLLLLMIILVILESIFLKISHML